jgi:hypothetical protein
MREKSVNKKYGVIWDKRRKRIPTIWTTKTPMSCNHIKSNIEQTISQKKIIFLVSWGVLVEARKSRNLTYIYVHNQLAGTE